jgi:hypothetical protein
LNPFTPYYMERKQARQGREPSARNLPVSKDRGLREPRVIRW